MSLILWRHVKTGESLSVCMVFSCLFVTRQHLMLNTDCSFILNRSKKSKPGVSLEHWHYIQKTILFNATHQWRSPVSFSALGNLGGSMKYVRRSSTTAWWQIDYDISESAPRRHASSGDPWCWRGTSLLWLEVLPLSRNQRLEDQRAAAQAQCDTGVHGVGGEVSPQLWFSHK